MLTNLIFVVNMFGYLWWNEAISLHRAYRQQPLQQDYVEMAADNIQQLSSSQRNKNDKTLQDTVNQHWLGSM